MLKGFLRMTTRLCSAERTSSVGMLAKAAAVACFSIVLFRAPGMALAGEADLAIPDLHEGKFNIAGQQISGWNLLLYGAFVICGTLGISLYLRTQIYRLPAHRSMLDISEIIFQTCKTYLIQQ